MDIHSVRDFIVYFGRRRTEDRGNSSDEHHLGKSGGNPFLYVDDAFRRRGIGRKLVEFLPDAITLELFRIFTLTYKSNSFAAE